MRIKYPSIYVGDQGKALKFYTEVLSFVKKADITAGQYRWLTVASPENQDGVELVFEPNENPACKNIPGSSFQTRYSRNFVHCG